MSVPEKMKALVTQSKGVAAVVDVPVPHLEDDEVLVKVEYVALNPTDWKHLADYSPDGAILGCDFTGKVVSLGSGASRLTEGDRVASFVHGGKFEDRGAFAQYAKVKWNRAFKVPEGMKDEVACQLGVGWITAAMCLFHHQGNAYPPAGQKKDGEWFLVQGGSTSVGFYAIQLAKLLGYRVVATCSPHSNDLVKSYGAEKIVDYHEASAAEDIKRLTNNGVVAGIECAGGLKSYELAVNAFGDKGGLLTALLLIPDEVHKIRKDVKVERILAYTIGGYSFVFMPGVTLPAKPADSDWFLDFVPRGEKLLVEGNIKGNPTDVRTGLDKVPEGLEELKAGKVSGKKLVYKIT